MALTVWETFGGVAAEAAGLLNEKSKTDFGGAGWTTGWGIGDDVGVDENKGFCFGGADAGNVEVLEKAADGAADLPSTCIPAWPLTTSAYVAVP